MSTPRSEPTRKISMWTIPPCHQAACLRADIFLVPAASDPVTSKTMRNALVIAGLLRVKIFRPSMSQTRALRALPDVSHRAMRVRAWTLRSEGGMDDDADVSIHGVRELVSADGGQWR